MIPFRQLDTYAFEATPVNGIRKESLLSNRQTASGSLEAARGEQPDRRGPGESLQEPSVLKSSSFPPLSLYAPRQPESPVGSTYVSRVGQQVLLHGTGLPPQPPLRPDPVGQVPHDDTLRLHPPHTPRFSCDVASRLAVCVCDLPTSDFSSCVRPGVADTLTRRRVLLTFIPSGLHRFLLEKALKIR